MKLFVYVFILAISPVLLFGYDAVIQGRISNAYEENVMYANVELYSQQDSTLVKVEATNEDGFFNFKEIAYGTYYIKISYAGFQDLVQSNVVADQPQVFLGTLILKENTTELNEVVISGQRKIVEVHPDRMVFNVTGTINSAGDNGLDLLRKAPGVMLDNNNNITLLGRAGVIVYLDGKRLPLSGEELANYLQNIVSEQIDRIDIITNPGSKYEAEGNAGIIDIKLKKEKNLGANGNISMAYSLGKKARYNGNIFGNYRNKTVNVFGSLGYNDMKGYIDIDFDSYQSDYFIREFNALKWSRRSVDYRTGADFFINKNNTIGLLVSGNTGTGDRDDKNTMYIGNRANPGVFDSTLIANNVSEKNIDQKSYNLNYLYQKDETSVNIDVDFGQYINRQNFFQPNTYYDASGQNILNSRTNSMNTPSDIKIMSAKIDYEKATWGGKLGWGGKVSKVYSDNTYLLYDVIDDKSWLNNQRSNQFKYSENVYAAYLNYQASLNKKWSMTGGVRLEQTDSEGDLTAFDPALQEAPVKANYLSLFPNLGFNYQLRPDHIFNINFGRRINRPDYNVLNPFRNQLSELSYEKGNAFLRPEIVNNAELGYTLKNKYNFKVAYSKTTDQITRLIGPDEVDPKASYISWDNLAHQDNWSFNASLPMDITGWWNVFLNVSGNYTDNQADYGNGAVVDVQAFSYNLSTQNSFKLIDEFKGEISAWYSGPGVWGGVFKYDPSYNLSVGLQKKFFNSLNIKFSMQDITYQSYWSGTSKFNGLESTGSGKWDSRRVALSINYDFGNSAVKSRRRTTGLENEAGRVGGGNE